MRLKITNLYHVTSFGYKLLKMSKLLLKNQLNTFQQNLIKNPASCKRNRRYCVGTTKGTEFATWLWKIPLIRMKMTMCSFSKWYFKQEIILCLHLSAIHLYTMLWYLLRSSILTVLVFCPKYKDIHGISKLFFTK